MIIPLLFLCFLAVIAAYQLRFTTRRRPARAWQEVVAKLERLNMSGIELIADGYLQPNSHQLEIEPPIMWELLGGDEGLKRMSANAVSMLELAVIAEQWNRVEGTIVAEMLRRDALRIHRAIRRIRLAFLWNGESVRAAFHLQEAAASYCLMRGRLLGLYYNAHIALVPQIEAAL